MSTASPYSADASAAADTGQHELELSVVMPCLNEAETLATCIDKAKRTIEQQGIAGEVVIADNGSTDGSQEIAERHGARVVHVVRKGYGSALMAGIESARGKYVVMGDADDSYDFTHIPRILERLRAGDQLVMGNRFRGGIEPGAMPPLHRYLGNPVLTGIGRLFFRCPSRDFHCGLRGFDRQAILGINLRTTGMEFASEMVIKGTLNGLRISEVPTTLSPDGRSRAPHLRSWRDGWRHLRFMLLFSPRWLFLYPGLALFALGVAVLLWLLPGARTVGGVRFDVHTMLYAAASVLVGFQAVLFAVLSKEFAIREGLVPDAPRWRSLMTRLPLEAGLICGFIMCGIGIIATVASFGYWGAAEFGDLDVTSAMRLVIPAVLTSVLGCQIVLSSFFLSVLGLGSK